MPPDIARDIVWCDFGGVLTPPVSEAIAAVERAFGIPWSVLAEAAERVSGRRGPLAPLELGELSQRAWAAAVERELPEGWKPARPLVRFGDAWYAGRIAAQPDMVNLLIDLKAAGWRIGLLTNSVREWEKLRAPILAPLGDLFDLAVRSHEMGVAKPDPEIYAIADRVALPRKRAVLIDDSRPNVDCAIAHGWWAVQHVGAEQTRHELVRLELLTPQPSALDRRNRITIRDVGD